MPDIEKLGDIAAILGVSCDYLLKDGATEERPAPTNGVSRLLMAAKGRLVKLSFFDEEADVDLYNCPCRIMDFEGNWMKVEANPKKGRIEKLLPVSSVCAIEMLKEED